MAVLVLDQSSTVIRDRLRFSSVNISLVCGLTVTLSGCSLPQKAARYLAAPRSAAFQTPNTESQDPAAKVYQYYHDSFFACMSFKEAFISANTGLNTGTDFVSLVLTAVASIISPIQTAHLFSGGATISNGLRTTVANNVNTGSLINITTAFNKIYFEPMAQLSKDITAAGVTNENYSGFLLQIDNLQNMCSLDQAQSYIDKNLHNAPAQAATGNPLPTPPTVAAAPVPAPAPPAARH